MAKRTATIDRIEEYYDPSAQVYADIRAGQTTAENAEEQASILFEAIKGAFPDDGNPPSEADWLEYIEYCLEQGE